MTPARVLLGVVEGAHGVQGLVKVKSFTADPADIASYGPLESGDGRVFKAKVRGMAKGNVLLSLSGVADRNQAEALRGTRLFVTREALPALNEEDEGFYHADLIGLEARLEDGGVLGKIAGLADYGAGDLLEVELSGQKRTVLLPFTKVVVPVVDLAQGFVVVAPPSGLLDEPGKGEDEKEEEA